MGLWAVRRPISATRPPRGYSSSAKSLSLELRSPSAWYDFTSNMQKTQLEALRHMTTYLAHYQSPAAADVRGSGVFEFESDARTGSKDNLRDARLKMLEIFGKDAASWKIEKVERKTVKSEALDGQLTLDFRPQKKRRKRRTKEYW